jgi:anti-sigma regulatory factor (Ser/Thr protein kinase)
MVILNLYLFYIPLVHRPWNTTKLAFSILCFSLVFLHLSVFVSWDFGRYILFFISSICVLHFSIHFPTYFRNSPLYGNFVYLLMGILFVICFFPMQISLTQLAVFSFSEWEVLNFIVFFTFAGIVISKVKGRFPSIAKFVYSTFFLFIVATIVYIFMIQPRILTIPVFNRVLLYIDIIFLTCFIWFLTYYSLAGPYLTIVFSSRYWGGKLLFVSEIQTDRDEVMNLKKKLIKLYDQQSFSKYLDQFWFQLIIDETLDNAFEHGGQRNTDEISVHVYENKNYIDIYVTDMGKGFAPKKIPDPNSPDRRLVPSGRGIHLLLRMFTIRWNFLGNQVNVRIPKSGEPGLLKFPGID